MNKLSYSKINTYNTCPRKYYLQYEEKLQEEVKGSALLFGTAFDKAIEAVLKNREVDEKKVFDFFWSRQHINGREETLSGSLLVNYTTNDFDLDILHPIDFNFFKVKAKELLDSNNWLKSYYECLENKKKKTWSKEENKFLNACCWLSLMRKGHLMLEANRTEILPLFKDVIGTQIPIRLDSESGDSVSGFIDCVVVLQDGTKCLLDYKTSSIEYEDDSVRNSNQLSLYAYAHGINFCGYAVFNKRISKIKIKTCETCGNVVTGSRLKTCDKQRPKVLDDGFLSSDKTFRCNGKWKEVVHCKVNTQFILDNIPETTETTTLNNLDEVNNKITNKDFTPNYNACKQPWGLCPYFSLCHKGSFEGLVNMKKGDTNGTNENKK